MSTEDGAVADVAVIIVAAGAGTRMGEGVPKAMRSLGGGSLLEHVVGRMARADRIGCLVIAAPPGHEGAVRESLRHIRASEEPTREPGRAGAAPLRWSVVIGGAQRRESVTAALAAVPEEFDIVLVHDAARALTPPSLAERVAAAVRAGHGVVIPVLPVADTVTRVDAAGHSLGHLDRSSLRLVQTPQGFRRAVLARAHARDTVQEDGHGGGAPVTDDAGLVAGAGVTIHTVPGAEAAFKITTPWDLAVAAALLAYPDAAVAGGRTLPP